MLRAKILVAAVIAILVVVLIAQNPEAVDTKLIFVTVTMPRAMLLLVTFLLGFAVGAIVATGVCRKGRQPRQD